MYNNQYMQNYAGTYGQQSLNDRIDGQISQLQQMKEQIKTNQQPAINQTFQLAPNSNHIMKYANTIDEVNKESVYFDTPYFSRDMSILWIKNAKGDVKTYELTEIIPKDNKDLQIEYLQSQIEELKKEIKENEKSNDPRFNDTNKSEEPTNVPVPRTSTKKSK